MGPLCSICATEMTYHRARARERITSTFRHKICGTPAQGYRVMRTVAGDFFTCPRCDRAPAAVEPDGAFDHRSHGRPGPGQPGLRLLLRDLPGPKDGRGAGQDAPVAHLGRGRDRAHRSSPRGPVEEAQPVLDGVPGIPF